MREYKSKIIPKETLFLHLGVSRMTLKISSLYPLWIGFVGTFFYDSYDEISHTFILEFRGGLIQWNNGQPNNYT